MYSYVGEIFPGEVVIPGGDPIISVAAGDCQAFAVALSGALWGWGSFKDGNGKNFFTLQQGDAKAKHCQRKQTAPMLIPGMQG